MKGNSFYVIGALNSIAFIIYLFQNNFDKATIFAIVSTYSFIMAELYEIKEQK